jgi:hypothetical protein
LTILVNLLFFTLGIAGKDEKFQHHQQQGTSYRPSGNP